ncbi:antibiotic biosynthesis monooxygenase family protein [Sphingobium aromaticivastans]|uniref:putative quinol monooxygenase n=1 Tax=Sphingobium aromaticivastans TaxID=1778665 RepID=UPI00301706A6
MIVQSYSLTAADGQEEALREALAALSGWLEQQVGNEGAHILQNLSSARAFLFLEYWKSEDARSAAGSALPKELMGALMACLADRPQSVTYGRL